MVGVRIRVDGRRKNFDRDESYNLIEQAAAEVEDRAKSMAPVDTGKLVNSINMSSITSRSAEVTSDCEYAVYQELGTSRGVPAKRFFEKAMDQVRAKYMGDLVFEYDSGY